MTEPNAKPGAESGAGPGSGSVIAGPTRGTASWDMNVDGNVLALSGIVDFQSARSILESVQSQLKSGGPDVIDLGGVTRINSAGLAVMIEWLSVARRQGLALSFSNVPSGLRELASVCQVDELLHIT